MLPNATGLYDNLQVNAWVNGSYQIDDGDSTGASSPSGWDSGGQITLNPGQAAWFNNAGSTSVNLTFVGQVPLGRNTVSLAPGFNMISSPAPIAGDIVTPGGLTNYNDGDIVYVWNPNGVGGGNYTTYNADIDGGVAGYKDEWDSPGDPVASVGQGFWYLSQARFM